MARSVTDAIAKLAIVVAAAVMGGCKTDADYSGGEMGRLMAGEYDSNSVVEVQVGGETYRIFDKPTANKMLVTMTFGAILVRGPGVPMSTQPIEAAVVKYLADTGRSSCRVTEITVVFAPKHEVKYDCTPAATAVAAKRKP